MAKQALVSKVSRKMASAESRAVRKNRKQNDPNM